MEPRTSQLQRIKEHLLLSQAVERGVTPEKRVSLECIHLGNDTGESVLCPSCRGTVKIKTFNCSIHGRATIHKKVPGAACCHECNDKMGTTSHKFAPIRTRNLLYYIYPVEGTGIWQQCIEELVPRLPLFNGKIIVVISQDPENGRSPYSPHDGPRIGKRTDKFETVTAHFHSWGKSLGVGSHTDRILFTEVKNNPRLWEIAHHKLLFGSVDSRNPTEATLYAHAKGTTRPYWHMAHRWRAALIETLMDGYHSAVAPMLRAFPVAGSFLKLGHGFGASDSNSNWHYSGSWFWFRNRELFTRDWQSHDNFWAAIETYPSRHFRRKEAGCIFLKSTVGRMNLYSAEYWEHVVEPELAEFRRLHSMQRNELTALSRSGTMD